MQKTYLYLTITLISFYQFTPDVLAHDPEAIAVISYHANENQFLKIDEIFSDIEECISHITSSAHLMALAFNADQEKKGDPITHANIQCYQDSAGGWIVQHSVAIGNLDGRWEVLETDQLLKHIK